MKLAAIFLLTGSLILTSMLSAEGQKLHVLIGNNEGIYVYEFNSQIGQGYAGMGDAADIHVSPDGKFLYANAHNEVNEVVAYSIDQKTGKLTCVGRQSSLGKGSRTFDIDPARKFMVLTNQATNTAIIFKRDQITGILTPTGQKIDINRPSMVKFVKTD